MAALRHHLGRPCGARPGGEGWGAASFLLLPHLHDVRALLRRRYVRHRRVLPLGGRIVLHLLFLDQRRRIRGAGAAGGGRWEAQRGRGLRGPLAMDLDLIHVWGRPRRGCIFRSACSFQRSDWRVGCVPRSVRGTGGGGGLLSPISPPIIYEDLALPEDTTSWCPPLPSPCLPHQGACQAGVPFCRPLSPVSDRRSTLLWRPWWILPQTPRGGSPRPGWLRVP